MYLSRLLRANSYYAGKELQEAYNRRFRSEMMSFLREGEGSLAAGLVKNMHYLCNLREAVQVGKIGTVPSDITVSVQDSPCTIPLRGTAEASRLGLKIALLEGEIRGFVTSGLFPLISTLSDADSFWALRDDLYAFLRASRHNLHNIINKGAVPFERGLEATRAERSSARLLYAQGESLIPLLELSFYLLRDRSLNNSDHPLIIPLLEGFRRAVNLFFAQKGIDRDTLDTFKYSTDAKTKGADGARWLMDLTIDAGPQLKLLKPVRFLDRSPIRELVPTNSPSVSGVELYGLSEHTVTDVWRDIAVDDVTSFRNGLAVRVVSFGPGLSVLFQELFYNACKHGNGLSIGVHVVANEFATSVTIHNSCEPSDRPTTFGPKGGLVALLKFAPLLDVVLDLDSDGVKKGNFVARLRIPEPAS